MDWHIGCSGFHYKHWREKFYPAKLPMRSWFEYYCQYFHTLELNVTHYRFPTTKNLVDWYDKTDSDFLFAVKVYKGITHFKKLQDCKRMVDDFYGIVGDGLKEKAGCILFQFPSSFRYNETNVERILENVNPGFQNAVEFRHADWWNAEAYDIFSRHNISFCGISHPTLPPDVISTAPVLYYRLHGNRQLYTSSYSADELRATVGAVSATGSKAAFIYFNNDNNASAVANALEMKRFI